MMLDLREIIQIPLIRGRYGSDPKTNTRIFGAMFSIFMVILLYGLIVEYVEAVQLFSDAIELFTIRVDFFLRVWGTSVFLFLAILAIVLQFPRWIAYGWYGYCWLFLIALLLTTALGWASVPAHIARSDLVIGYSMLTVTVIAVPSILFYRDYRYRKDLDS